jgi:integrase
MAWSEVEGVDWASWKNSTGGLWRVPAARMKLSLDKKEEEAFDHLVPLSLETVEVLVAVRRLTGRGELVFPSQRHAHRPMSENAIGYLYNRVGLHGRHVPHGWRAVSRR